MNFNFKRVYTGIGNTQRRILTILAVADVMVCIKILVFCVYFPESGKLSNGKFLYTESQYKNIHRAVLALEKRGLVRTEIVPYRRPNGQLVRVKGVRLPKVEKESK